MDKRLVALLADIFGLRPAEIHSGLEKKDVGTWDSLKQMDLVVTLEREYKILLNIQDILRMVTVTNIIEILREKGVNLED